LAEALSWPWRGTDRRTAVVLLASWGPIAAFGAILTVSIFGAPFGIPVLLGSAPPTFAGWRLLRSRTVPRWCLGVGLVACAGLLGLVAWGIVTGIADDGLSAAHVLLALAAAVWAWLAAGALVGADRRS
jgi:hypothetical protein